MEKLKFNGNEYDVYLTGEAVIIAMDELQSDFFRLARELQSRITAGEIPLLDVTAKLMYCAIKCANPSSFRNYKIFMQSTKNISDFIDADNFVALNKLINDAFSVVGEEEETEAKKKEPAPETVNH